MSDETREPRDVVIDLESMHARTGVDLYRAAAETIRAERERAERAEQTAWERCSEARTKLLDRICELLGLPESAARQRDTIPNVIAELQSDADRARAILVELTQHDEPATLAELADATMAVAEAVAVGLHAPPLSKSQAKRFAVQRSPAAAAADQPSPTEYNAETLATMLDQARAGNAELQGELERVAALLERRAKESDQMATVASEANDPVTEAHFEGMSIAYDIAMKYLRRMVAHPAPSAPAEQSAPVSKSQAKRIAIQSESAPGGTACPECGGTGEVIDDPLEHEASTKLVYVPCPSCSTGRDEAGKL